MEQGGVKCSEFIDKFNNLCVRQTCSALECLFRHLSPALVLKSAHGSPFIGNDRHQQLACRYIFPLFSSTHTPQYNGYAKRKPKSTLNWSSHIWIYCVSHTMIERLCRLRKEFR